MCRIPRKLVVAVLFCGVLSLSPLAVRSAEIDVGAIVLQPNQAGQTVVVRVTGGEQIAGVNFFAQVGDGGPELAGTDGPSITVDLESGIFLSNHDPQSDLLRDDGGSFPQLVGFSIVTNSGTIAAEGDLATITFDTTGFDSGTWGFSLNTLAGDTLLSDAAGDAIVLTVVPGSTITIVPSGVPTVETVEVNGGASQRSVVTSLAVTFSSQVTIDAGAFEVIQRVTGTPVGVTVLAEDVGGKTTATLTFSGTPTEYGSLVDGNYQLTIRGDRVRGAVSGLDLDGDGDGNPGGDYLFGTELVDNFFRFFGDTDGDRDVDGPDFGRFGLTFRKGVGDDGFNPDLDYDGDGDVDGQDYGQFALRFRESLDFE